MASNELKSIIKSSKLQKKLSLAKSNQIQKGIRLVQRKPQFVMSQGQAMLNEMFNGEPTFGTGQNLPELNETLTSGQGIIKSGDNTKATARMFGFGYG